MNSTVDGGQAGADQAGADQAGSADQPGAEQPADQQGSGHAGQDQSENGQQRAAQAITGFREEIDWLDAEILRLVKRRAEVSRQVGEARMAAGGTRVVYNREMDVLARYRELGPEGRELAMILLRLGRGHLGH